MTSATVFPDTTILIQYQSIDRIDWRKILGVKHVKLMLSSAVLQEIEEIKNQDISIALAKRAALALRSIESLLNQDSSAPDYLQVKTATPPLIDFSLEQLDPNSIADLLVATVIAHQSNHALEYVVLFSDDKETLDKAREAGLEVASLPKDYLFSSKAESKKPDDAQKEEAKKLFDTSPNRLSEPTPLFKNTFIKQENGPEPIVAQKPQEPKEETESPAKLFQVITPEETPAKSPVIAVEQPAENHEENLDSESAQAKDKYSQHEHSEPTPPFTLNGSEIEPPTVTTPDLTEDESIEESIPEAKLPGSESPNTESPNTEPPNTGLSETEPPKPKRPPFPFIDIKQEPARPDRSHTDFHPPNVNLPKTNGTRRETSKEPRPSMLPSNRVEPKAPEQKPKVDDNPRFDASSEPPIKHTHSFSFSSQSTSKKTSDKPPPVEKTPVEEKPDLRLAFEGDDARSAIIIHHPEYPSIDEVSERIAEVRKSYPKLATLGASSGDGVGNGIHTLNEPVPSTGNDLVFQRRNNRIKRYNDALDTFYASSEKYLSEEAEFENLRRRSARMDLILLNHLPDSLRSLYIAIHFPSNLRVYSEDNLPEKPVGPVPPEEPNLDALFDVMRLPSVPIPGELSSENSNIKMRSRNLAPAEVRWNKGWDVIYSIREIEKDEQVFFNPLFIVFNSFEQATSFRIQFRITVASASYEEKGNLEVLVRKEI